MEISTVIALFYDLFVNQVFGNIALTGVFVFVLMIALGIAYNVSIDTMMVIAIPTLVALVGYNFLATWLWVLVAFGIAVILGLAMSKLRR